MADLQCHVLLWRLLEGESKVIPVLNNALLYDGRRMDQSRYGFNLS